MYLNIIHLAFLPTPRIFAFYILPYVIALLLYLSRPVLCETEYILRIL